MSGDTFLHFISDQGVNTNKVSNNQNGSDGNTHLKKRKSISTSAMEGQIYKLLSCPYTNVFKLPMHLFINSLAKGGLISEGILTLVSLPTKGAKSLP